MTSSRAITSSFTLTDARHVGAKIGADLRLLYNLHGRPALADIDNYVEEVALLLRDGHLGTVDYGFMDSVTRDWKLRLRYTATLGGQLVDSRPGGLPTTGNFTAYSFYSYLTYSAKFNALNSTQQSSIKQTLPITRSGADEPSTGAGSTSSGNGYGRNGAGVNRDIYTAY